MGQSLRSSPGWTIPIHRFVALCGGWAWRGDCATAWLLEVCLELDLFPVTSLTPCMQLAPFQLLPLCWIPEWVGMGIFQDHAGPLSGVPENLAVSSTVPTPTARSNGDLDSLYWNPRLCSLPWDWDCSLPRYPSWFLFTTRECGTTYACSTTASLHNYISSCLSAPSPCLCSPTHLDECGFFKSLVVGLP